ncbi:MAG: hypothetical protein A3F31_00985 [Candidatus Levybacteria bacterium RIFCSPHIGHO2_12_FULL_38_12]|nr:MAG: hypothetical protein A2770_01615 [Candidatus Levybacteria bacterium RIFCSPHIGHO2_01_FULL_38_12]OGH21995.1 MAG: hypothetical protein A3D75_03145 [Candidatus Levybacteria bacterium RIFCSPHIGHO2_02_FULL_37_18]OGH23066.1 MAG: hypothetical protein A3F31_00985 [Candidatus Levybacteria bacterium RIFCSPHIGHO2_12_FULL_38_12]OGH33688.1 MAG: hypothetical protein A3A47_02580 [Candidatus Levybacteria bacterium RIFCSPLOWO2_01_FULL_37_20]OGH44594.1 MAG: hypothetical protein A3J14_00665 [Candidatus Lev
MPKRRYRRRGPKLKLRKETIYTLFALGFILAGGLLLLTFFTPPGESGGSFTTLNTKLQEMFGFSAILFPFVIILFGFLFLRLKLFISKPNVALGFVLFFTSLVGLTQGGRVGEMLFRTFAEMITKLGSMLVFLIGVFVGLVVLFDTTLDELTQGVSFTIKNILRFYPKNLINSLFKTKKQLIVRNKPIAIKGGGIKDVAVIPAANIKIQHVKKEPELLSEKLVTNTVGELTSGGIWEYPALSLLSDASNQKADRGDIKKVAAVIEKTLQSFGVDARVSEVNLGPAVTQYALEIALGTKVSKITALSNDLALATEAPTGQIRIEAPIPGRNLVGIEIPNKSLEIVTLKTILVSSSMQRSKSKLTAALGLDVSGNSVVADIAKMPHVLVAGTTGSGKSVLINSFICTLLFRASPAELKLILVDPKRVEFTAYNGIPHLLTPVIVEPEKILSALKWAMGEMDRRYKLFAERGVKNIDGYNELSGFQALPYIVIVIDELADLMMFAPVDVEDSIARLAQMARATGIHLVIATQRPSVNIITGLIKANIPCRIAFNVSSMIDSRVIIDGPGAEKLLGRGDMLYVPPDQAKPTRIQGTYVSEKEVKKLVDFLKSKGIPVEYTEEVTAQQLPLKKGNGHTGGGSPDGRDPLFEEAIRTVCQHDRASASLLQRRLSVGYSRAARILDQLEEIGIVGPGEGAKPRDVLVQNAQEFLNSLHGQEQ